MSDPVCQKPGCGSRRVAKIGDFWWCRDHGFHSVGCRCDKCITYLDPPPKGAPHVCDGTCAAFGCNVTKNSSEQH